jgi:hypothetical protein
MAKKSMPTSGYQETLDTNTVKIIIEEICKSIPSPWIQSHVYVPTSYKKFISKCNLKTDTPK